VCICWFILYDCIVMHGAKSVKLVDKVACNYFPNSSNAIYSICCRREFIDVL